MNLRVEYRLYQQYTLKVLKVTPLDYDPFVIAWMDMNEKRKEMLLELYRKTLREKVCSG